MKIEKIRLSILKNLMRKSPFQPATNFWRAIEVHILATNLPLIGKGLDIGCGDGRLTEILGSHIENCNWELTGIDLDSSEIQIAKQNSFYSKLITCSATKIPETDSTFDFAFSNSVLEHIANLEDVLKEISRCLKPNARFFVTVPSDNFHSCLKGGFKLFGKDKKSYIDQIDRRLQHVHYLSKEQWHDILKLSGFKLLSVHPYLSINQIQLWEFYSNWTGGLIYKLFSESKTPLEIQKITGLKKEAHSIFYPIIDYLSEYLFEKLLNDKPSDISGAYLITAVKNQ